MDSYDDLCPRCYLNNSKECRDCITKDARRELAREVQDKLSDRGNTMEECIHKTAEFVNWLREIAEEGEA